MFNQLKLNKMPNEVLDRISLNLDAGSLSWDGNHSSNESLFTFRLTCRELRLGSCFEFSERFAYRLTEATFSASPSSISALLSMSQVPILRNKIKCLRLVPCGASDSVSYHSEQELPDVVYTFAYILQQFKSAANLEAIEIGDNYNAMIIALEISKFSRSIVDLRIDLGYLRGNHDTTLWKAASSKNEFLRRLVFPKPTTGWYQCSHDSYYQPSHPSLGRLLKAYRHVPELEIIGCIDGCLGWTQTCRGCLDLYDNHLFNVAFTQLRYVNLSRTFMGCDLFCYFLREHSNHLKQLILSNVRLVQGSWKDVFAVLQAATEVEEFQMACLYQKHNIKTPKDLDSSEGWPHIQVLIRGNGVKPFLCDACKFFGINVINRTYAKVDLLVIPGISFGLDDSIICSHCS